MQQITLTMMNWHVQEMKYFTTQHKNMKQSCIIFEVFTAVTIKNAVFWDIKTQFVPHRRHITSPLQNPGG
jgi:hypothetical protein